MSSSNSSRKKGKSKKTKHHKNTRSKNGRYDHHESKTSYSHKSKSKHHNDDDEQESSYSEESSTRIWICSWNMAAKDHFKFKTTYDGRKIPDDDQTQKFEQIVPTNYDLYIFGVQEGVSDTFFQYISLYLKEFDVERIPLKYDGKRDGKCFGVHGRGDGSFMNTKYTGIAVYYRRNLSPYISLKSSSAVSCGLTQGSKGAACILLKIYSTTIVFLSTHMSSNSTQNKLEHFKILVNKSGDTLGCSGFDLLTQFHHIIWFGDLNYRITHLTADNVLQNMALGNLNKLWQYDSLRMSKRNDSQSRGAFKGFLEPIPRLDFYPTYKKKPNRQLDFDQNPKELRSMSASSQQSSLSQLDKIYTTKYKEPFYKGGTVQDRIPSFCDRVLYYSLCEKENYLYPELDTGVLNCVEFSYKKDECNNYGCIPHHLMGSDHSAIYCGLVLKSPLLFPCPPHELNDGGLPKSYQLKIEDIKIMRKSPYHIDSTYSEFPIKCKILFPIPYEIENFKYKNYKPYAYNIAQQDLEMYHKIQRQITIESKRRLSQQNRHKHNLNNIQNNNVYPLITPQTSHRHKNQDALIINAKPVIDKGLNVKKPAIIDSDDDWNNDDIMPTYDILSNGSNNNSNKSPSPNKILSNDNNNEENNSLANRRDSAPNIKKRQLPSDYIFKSENQTENEINNNLNYNQKNKYRNRKKHPLPKGPLPQPPKNKNKKKHPLQLSPKNSTTSPANSLNNSDAKFGFSFDYNDNKTFNLSNQKPQIPISPKPNKRESVIKRVNNKKNNNNNNKNKNSGGINKNNPLHSYLNDNNNNSKVNPLKNAIKDDYFENENEDDIIAPINISKKQYTSGDIDIELFDTHTPTSTLQRTRSKSMGSFAETMETKIKKKKIIDDENKNNSNYNENNNSGNNLHNIKNIPRNSDLMDLNNRKNMNNNNNMLSSPIYKDLAEISKKLTIISFGPSRRPTHGNIHCSLKVETNDFKGQCCIPFKWSDFANEIEDIQYAELTYHGIPLYDKTGSPIKLKIHYKLSLIDKQIVFNHN